MAAKVLKSYQIDATFQLRSGLTRDSMFTLQALDGQAVWDALVDMEKDDGGGVLLHARVREVDDTTGEVLPGATIYNMKPKPPLLAAPEPKDDIEAEEQAEGEWFEDDAFHPVWPYAATCTYKEDDDDTTT